MPRWLKRIGIALGLLALSMVVVVVVALHYLETRHAQGLIQQSINRAIPGELAWESFRVSLLQGTFEWKGGALKGPTGDELAAWDRLFVKLSWPALIRRDIVVTSLTVERPRVDLRLDAAGNINLTSAFLPSGPTRTEPEKKKATPMAFNITLGALNISGGTIRFEAQGQDLTAAIRGIECTANGNLAQQSADCRLKTGQAEVSTLWGRTHLDGLSVRAAYRKGRLDPLVVSVLGPALKLSLEGSVGDLLKGSAVDLAADMEVDLGEWGQILPLPRGITGHVVARCSARGAVEDPDVTLDLDYAGGSLYETPVEGVSLSCSLRKRHLSIDDLEVRAFSGLSRLRAEVDLREAFPEGLLAPIRDLESLSYRVHLEQEGLHLSQINKGPGNLKGAVDTVLTVSGKGICPDTLAAQAHLKLFAKGLDPGATLPPMDLEVTAEGGLSKSIATIGVLEVKGPGVRVQAQGRYDIPAAVVDGSVEADAADLEGILSSLGIADVAGALGLKVLLSGPLRRPEADLTLKTRGMRVRNVTVGAVQVGAVLDGDGVLSVRRLLLENKGSRIKGTGSVRVFERPFTVDPRLPSRFTLSLDGVQARDFLAGEVLAGTVSGRLELEGGVKSLVAALAVTGTGMAVQGTRLGDVDARLHWSQGRLRAEQVTLRNGLSAVSLQGEAQLLTPGTFEMLRDPSFAATLEAEALHVGDFFPQFKGDVSLSARLEGTMGKPRGEARLRARDLDTGAQRLRQVDVSCRLADRRLWVDQLGITVAEGQQIDGKGWVTLDGEFQMELGSEAVALEKVDAMRRLDMDQGTMAFRVLGKGRVEDPQVEAKVMLRGLNLAGKAVQDFVVRFDLREQLARVRASLDFDLEGSYHLRKKDFAATLRFDDTALYPYFKAAGQGDLGGTLTGSIEAAGNAHAVKNVTARAVISSLNVSHRGLELVRGRDLRAIFEKNVLSLPGMDLEVLGEGRVTVRGEGALDGPLDFVVEGSIPARVMSRFAEQTGAVTGSVNMAARLRGTRRDPDIRADVVLEKIGCTVPVLMQTLHGIDGRISVTSGAVTVERIQGKLDTGSFEVSGKVDLENLKPARATVDLRASVLPLRIPDTMDILLNTRLHFEGTEDQSALRGEVVLLEGTYYKDVNLSLLQGIREKTREEAPQPSPVEVPFVKNMQLDVSVKRRNPFRVDNNLALLDINPDLRITGSVNHPVVNGRASVEVGTITYRKKTFVVKKGVIDFVNPYKLEPTLDIESEADVRKWKVYLNIEGVPERLSFQLTSEPPLEHGDILSLLLLGRTTGELIEQEGGTSQSTRRLLTEVIADTMGKDIKEVAGLDLLEVEDADGEGPGGSGGVKVTLGKDLSSRLSVKYAVESRTGEARQRAVAEYKLLESVLLTGFQDSKGSFGGELQFRLEFR